MADPTAYVQRVARAVTDPAPLVAALGPAQAATLHDGLPGTALLLAALSTADPALGRAAEHHWETAARLLAGAPADGIHRGPGALATSLIIGSGYLPNPDSHRAAVRSATAWLSARAQGLARHQDLRRRSGRPGTPWGVYDSIKGLSGIGRILLAADRTGHTATAAPGLTAALTVLTAMLNAPALPLPGWWLPTQDHALPTAHPLPPSGAATTGLAHGIAGPLAFLALAHRAGRSVPRQRDALRTAANWLITWRNPDGTWPAHIPGEALRHGPQSDSLTIPGRRDAWCYGAAGIGNAIILAGQALHDGALTHQGHAALHTIAARPTDQWDTTGPGLCHGTAGILHAAHQHDHHDLAGLAGARTQFLTNSKHDSLSTRQLGFLTGATGTALAQAERTHLLPQHTARSWAAPLLSR